MAKVVILDDEPWSRQVVQSLIEWERLGLEPAGVAEDGLSGLELIGRVHPEIVITDMRMPGMDGIALLERLRTDHPDIRILVMSGYDDFPLVREALKSRAMDYLLKPLDPAELNRVLESCLTEMRTPGDDRPVSLKTTVLFDDVAVLEEYISIRRIVFGHLLELDDREVDRDLSALEAFLDRVSPGINGTEVLNHIAGDFLRMLDEFLSLNCPGSAVPETGRSPQLVSDISGLCGGIRDLYHDSIMAVVTEKRQRDHLNPLDVRDHIDRHYRDPISLESVSRMFLVSKEHLSRLFRREFGVTVHDYITTLRMERARYLITEKRLEIKEAALLTGYSELAYFYRVFKKHFGITPGQVRERRTRGQ